MSKETCWPIWKGKNSMEKNKQLDSEAFAKALVSVILDFIEDGKEGGDEHDQAK